MTTTTTTTTRALERERERDREIETCVLLASGCCRKCEMWTNELSLVAQLLGCALAANARARAR